MGNDNYGRRSDGNINCGDSGEKVGHDLQEKHDPRNPESSRNQAKQRSQEIMRSNEAKKSCEATKPRIMRRQEAMIPRAVGVPKEGRERRQGHSGEKREFVRRRRGDRGR